MKLGIFIAIVFVATIIAWTMDSDISKGIFTIIIACLVYRLIGKE